MIGAPYSEWAKAETPLPPRGSSTAAAFWRGYTFGAQRVGLLGGAKGSPAWQAYQAGLARRKAEGLA